MVFLKRVFVFGISLITLIGVLLFISSFFISWDFFDSVADVVIMYKDKISSEKRGMIVISMVAFSIFFIFYLIKNRNNNFNDYIRDSLPDDLDPDLDPNDLELYYMTPWENEMIYNFNIYPHDDD